MVSLYQACDDWVLVDVTDTCSVSGFVRYTFIEMAALPYLGTAPEPERESTFNKLGSLFERYVWGGCH